MDEVTQQNAALVEEAAAAAGSLQEQAQRLAEAVSVFRINEGQVIDVSAQQLARPMAPRVAVPAAAPARPASPAVADPVRLENTGRANSTKPAAPAAAPAPAAAAPRRPAAARAGRVSEAPPRKPSVVANGHAVSDDDWESF
jgi:hypothetical protein